VSGFIRLVEFEAERAANGTPPAGSCCPCSTAAARPAPAPWPASTAGCSSGSRRSPPPSWTAGFPCPRGRKPWSRCAPCRGGSDEIEGRGDRRGTAGITAAIALAETGADVTLLEARPRLGGATCSFSRDGLTVDTGQRIFLGCCSAYRGLLHRHAHARHPTLPARLHVPRPRPPP